MRKYHNDEMPQLGLSGRLIAKKLSRDGSESIRDVRSTNDHANADFGPEGKLSFWNTGRSRQNEQGNLAVAAALVQKLNLQSGSWSFPVFPEGREQGVDCVSESGDKTLSLQITKVAPSQYLKELNDAGSTKRDCNVHDAVFDIMKTVRTKARKCAARDRAQLVLALDATDTPAYTMYGVLATLRDEHELELRDFGYQAIWLVGAEPTLTCRIDNNE